MIDELVALAAKLGGEEERLINRAIDRIDQLQTDVDYWYTKYCNPPPWAQDDYGATP